MKILVITGDHSIIDTEKPTGHFEVHDLETHQAMVDAFQEISDWDVEVLTDHSKFIDRLRLQPPQLVVNFCDTGLFNKVSLESCIPALCDSFEVGYTGCGPEGILSCYDKSSVNLIAQSMGIAVAQETFFEAGRSPDWSSFEFPLLIKPNCADGSLGITKDAVVKSAQEAERYLGWLATSLPNKDFLVQEYLSGDEYGLALVGNGDNFMTPPPLKVDYSKLSSELAPILSYESKSVPDSPYWTEIGFQRADLNKNELEEIKIAAIRLFHRLRLRDYARFDFRKDAQGKIKLIEVNPNPAWGSDGKLAIMASFQNMSYRELLKKIVEVACLRLKINL